MAGLVSSLILVVMLKALIHAHGQRAVFLTVLLTVIAADSSVTEESLLDFTDQPIEYLGGSSTGSSPSALPASLYTAFESPDSPGFLQPKAPADITLFQLGHVPLENSKSNKLSDLLEEEPQSLSTPLLIPFEPVLGYNPKHQAPTKPSTDWLVARTNSAMQSFSLFPAPTNSKRQSQENVSLSSPSASTKSTTPQLVNFEKVGSSEQKPTNTTSQPVQPLEPPILAFPDHLADELQSEILDVNQLSPSLTPLRENKPAHDINILANSNEILAPSYNVPFIAPHPTSPTSEPTEASPEDFYPTNTMELDWGSGDYMETMSFLDSHGDDYNLVTKVPSDSYDFEDYTESYDTSFPSRVGLSPSSMHPLHLSPSPSLMTKSGTTLPVMAINSPSFSPTVHHTLEPTLTADSDTTEASDVNWLDAFTIQPTDVLLPDMNSLEYYTIQLSKENGSDTGAEHRGNVTVVSIDATDNRHSISFTNDFKLIGEESSGEFSGSEPRDNSTVTTETFLAPSIVPSVISDSLSSMWGGQVYTTNLQSVLTDAIPPSSTPLLPDNIMSSSSLVDGHWFVTEPFLESTVYATPVLTQTIAFSPVLTEPSAGTPAGTTEKTTQDSTYTSKLGLNITLNSTVAISNVTLSPPVILSDQGVTEDGADISATTTLISTSSEANTISSLPTTTNATIISHQATTRITTTTEASTSVNVISSSSVKTTTAPRQYLCSLDKPTYLVKIDFPSGATVGYAKSQVRDILKAEFNKTVEIQVVNPTPKFVFRVVSGPVIYTAISVINALQRSRRRFLSVYPDWTPPDSKYQVHTVLQFVPNSIDVRSCIFSENIEKGLTMAFAEVCRRSKESTDFTIHIINITMDAPRDQEQRLVRQPVDIIFTVDSSVGHLMGSEVSSALMKLTMVEFSYYMGFPVLQIAEPFHYPELNTSQLLCSTWVRTVLLGVLDQKVEERTFQANIERRVAMLLGEAIGLVRRVKRATTIGNRTVQVVSATRLPGADNPLEIVYFVEGPSGQRVPAVETANLLNSLDVQRAAIVLGYRVQGILAQPVEKELSSTAATESTNMWIVIGVVIPLLVVIVIISILYWKLCRTDKLEFQPDAMTSMQQRQKLQAPSVKGFDFAKLHLGQQSKDEVMVIQEPVPQDLGPGPLSIKDGLSTSENGEIRTPISKTSASSTKASRSGRRRERISPSDGDSVVSDHSSERESTEENLRAHTTPCDSKQTRRVPINVLNGPPPISGTNEHLSSASIFEHVDRMSRSTDASRRIPNKVQLIAMQPMPVPPLHSPPTNGKLPDTNQINKEIQVALRHKSEIEHHRNKIRLRAKRKGHYDFPAMDDLASGFRDAKDQDCVYQKAQLQIDKILDPDAQMPPIFMESKKGGRGRRSPKQRMKEQLNGGMMEADKDQLISEDSDAGYRKCPGVNNVAYVSDPDQGPGSPHRSPSPIEDVFMGPTSSPPGHAPPPPPYMPPQPSIEEARQQMHSLLDDAFALVSPTSQGPTAGITLPGANSNPPGSSPLNQGPRPWGPSYQALNPFPGRFAELSLSPPAVQGLTPRQGLGSGYLPPGETTGHGAQLHHLTHVGLSSRMNGFPAGLRDPPGQNGGIVWNQYQDNRAEAEKDAMPRSGIRDSSIPPNHLDPSVVDYMPAPPPLNTSPPTHSSASLIKAIREELLRLSQKQAAVSSYHS